MARRVIILPMRRKRSQVEVLLYTPTQVAEMLALSPEKVRKMCQQGEIPSIKIGRCVRIHKDDLFQWLDQQRGIG